MLASKERRALAMRRQPRFAPTGRLCPVRSGVAGRILVVNTLERPATPRVPNAVIGRDGMGDWVTGFDSG